MGENERFLEPDGKVLRATAHSGTPFSSLKKVGAGDRLSAHHSVREHSVITGAPHIAPIGHAHGNIPST